MNSIATSSLFLLCLFFLFLSACGGGNNNTPGELTPQNKPQSLILTLDDDIYAPRISSNNLHMAVATWRQNDSVRDRLAVYANVFDGTSWGDNTLIDASSEQDATLIQTAINSSGQAIVSWVQWDSVNTRYNIWANLYTPSTGWLSAPQQINISTEGVTLHPNVAINDSGNAIAIWSSTQTNINRSQIFVRHYVSGSWSGTETQIGLGEAYTPQPQIQLNNDNTALAVWDQRSNGWVNIYNNTFNGTTWAVASTIENNSNGDASAPQIAANSLGNVHVIWHQPDGENKQIWHNHYTHETGLWSTAQRVDAEDEESDARFPMIALDDTDNALAVWLQPDPEEEKESIWSNHFSVTDGWGEATLIEANDTNHAYAPQVIYTQSGQGLASWIQMPKDLQDNKIMINRFNPDSNTWAENEIFCHPQNHFTQAPQLSNNSSKYALAAWEYSGNQDYDCDTQVDEDDKQTTPDTPNHITIDWIQ